jgi:uncharacterized GH25 family protein
MRPLHVLLLAAVAILALALGLYFSTTNQEAPPAVAPTPAEPVAGAPSESPDVVKPAETQRGEGVEADSGAPPRAGAGPISSPLRSNKLVGRVVDAGSQPVPGAKVILSRDPMMGEQIGMHWFMGRQPTGKKISTTTDAQGRYEFKGVEPANDYFVAVQHPDFAQVQEELVAVAEGGESMAPEVVLRKGSTLAGYVRDIGGNPVGNAVLHLDSAYMMGQETESPDRMTTTTDPSGYYEFKNISAGPRVLTVSAEGYGLQVNNHLTPFKGHPDDDGGSPIDFRLSPGKPIAGRIIGPDGMGIPGARVLAMNYGNTTGSRGEGVADEGGAFQIDGLQDGSYILMVNAPGFRALRLNRVQVGEMNVQVDMVKQACIAGRVFDSEGSPVASFTGSALRTSPDLGATPIFEATSIENTFNKTADGAFELCGLDPGTYAVQISAAGYAPTLSESFTVAEGQPLPTINVRLTRGGTIKGRVLDSSGAGVAGARVSSRDNIDDGMAGFFGGMISTTATSRETRTGPEGAFELTLLNPGVYRIVVEHPRYAMESITDLHVGDGTPVDVGALTLKEGGTVQGKVVTQAGQALPGAFVQLLGNDPTFSYQTRTDSEGKYRFEHVRQGSYKLSATRMSSGAATDPIGTILDQQHSETSVSVADGTAVTRELYLGN